MKEDKFKVIQFVKEFIVETDKLLDNIPRKDIEIKNRIRGTSYELFELICYANTTNDVNKKIALLEQAVAKIKVLDFLLNLSYDKQIITTKKYTKLGLKMDDIIKYISGWLRKLQT